MIAASSFLPHSLRYKGFGFEEFEVVAVNVNPKKSIQLSDGSMLRSDELIRKLYPTSESLAPTNRGSSSSTPSRWKNQDDCPFRPVAEFELQEEKRCDQPSNGSAKKAPSTAKSATPATPGAQKGLKRTFRDTPKGGSGIARDATYWQEEGNGERMVHAAVEELGVAKAKGACCASGDDDTLDLPPPSKRLADRPRSSSKNSPRPTPSPGDGAAGHVR
jgi:hypothetical protein